MFISLGTVGATHTDILAATSIDVYSLLAVIVALILATTFIAGTGASGGLFRPIMFLGSLLGILIASIIGFPYPIILAIVGISASLCTTLNVPVTSAIICIELFGPIALVPSIMGTLVGYFIGKRYVIYHEIRWRELR